MKWHRRGNELYLMLCLSPPMPSEIQKLVKRINTKYWWHVTPADPLAYQKRGKFFASTYSEAEFYGRPNNEPEKVCIRAPLVGDSNTVEKRLLGKVEGFDGMSISRRLALDAKMRKIALRKGYDCIVILSHGGYRRFRGEGKMPRSIELNVIDLGCLKTSANPNGIVRST